MLTLMMYMGLGINQAYGMAQADWSQGMQISRILKVLWTFSGEMGFLPRKSSWVLLSWAEDSSSKTPPVQSLGVAILQVPVFPVIVATQGVFFHIKVSFNIYGIEREKFR